MPKSFLLNAASLLLLLILSTAYASFIAIHVPAQSAIAMNLVIVPMIFGALGYFLIKAPFYVAILLLALLPIVHIIYFGGDPAKPGLERLVGGVEFAFLCFGFTVAHLVRRYMSSAAS